MKWKDVGQAAIILILTMVIVAGASLVANLFKKEPTVIEIPTGNGVIIERPVVSCSPDFVSYQTLAQDARSIVNLISERTPTYAENGSFNSKVVVTKIETEKSKVACGYLMVRAGTYTNGSLQSWENLYINPNEFGGHINPETNIGQGDGSAYSEYVFPLSKINYWKTRNDRVRGNLSTADWGVLLNVSKTIGFDIGLNTNDKTGFIDQFSIVYKCWNPETGQQNYDCKIEIID